MTGPAGGPALDGPAGYRIVQTIGHGASSTVYEAVQDSTGRRVALKVVAASTPGGDAEHLYTRERSVLAGLGRHPHIVSIIDAGEWNGRFWLAMEHCPYGLVARAGAPLSVPDAVAVLAGVGAALETAHRAGLVHCDVKPANILRNECGDPALADFGIARFVLATGHGSTAAGYTLDHASPEVLDGERPTEASDVWSLGTSIWELLEGRSPFRRAEEASQSVVIRRICFDPTPPLAREDVPNELRALVAAMTEKSPADRPAIADVIARARALQEVVGAPDPEQWARTIAAPVAPEILGQDGAYVPFETSTGPSAGDPTTFRRVPRQEAAPPAAEASGPRSGPGWRPSLILAAALVVVLLLGGGGMVTWRLANAESAPVAAPPAPAPPTTTTASTTAEAPAPSVARPAVVLPEVGSSTPTARDAGANDTGGAGDGGNTARKDTGDEGGSSPPSSPEAKTIGGIELTGTTCRASGNTCSSTTTAVSFAVSVTDSDGKAVSDGCTATTSLIKAGMTTTTYGKKACGSRVSLNANGSGDYVIQVDASYNGNSQSKSFRLVVE